MNEQSHAPPRAIAGVAGPAAGFLVAFIAAFLAASALGYRLLERPAGVAVVWPAAGILVAALLVSPRRRWPAIALAAAVAAVGASVLLAQRPAAVAAGFVLLTFPACGAGAAISRRLLPGRRPAPATVRDALAIVLPSAAVMLALAAVQQAWLAVATGSGSAAPWVYATGGALGVLAVTPCALAWTDPAQALGRWSAPRVAEALALGAAHLLAAAALLAPPGAFFAHELVVMPPMLWAAFRFRIRGATASAAAITCAVAWAAVRGHGHLATLGAVPAQRTLTVQFFLALLVGAVLLVAVAVDERRRGADARRRTEERLQLALSGANVGLWHHDCGSGSIEAEWPGAFLGRPPGAVAFSVERFLGMVHPGDEAPLREGFEAHLRGDRPVFEVEARVRSAAGAWSWIHLRGRVTERDAAGRPARVAGTVLDVSERRRTEGALRLSRFAIHRAEDAIVVLDAAGRVIEANVAFARTVGRAMSELVGVDARWLLRETGAADWGDFLAALERDGTAVAERWIGAGGGEERPYEMVGWYLAMDGQRYAIVSLRDLTMRRRAEESARLAGIGTLAAGVAHEINNPLAYVASNLGFVREQLRGLRARGPEPELDEAIEALDDAVDGASRVRDIVRDLKAFSRAEPRVGAVDAVQAMQAALGIARNEIRHRARLETRFDPVPPVVGNEHRLGQVFLNLLVNAAQAIPEGHAEEHLICASVHAEHGEVVAEVRDTGCGMSAPVRARIFEPFFTTKPVGSGTGLGLSICHGIVEAMGGRVEVETAPGKGSTFRVILPPTALAEVPRPATPAPALAAPRARVLVVDDDANVGAALRRILAAEHDVTVVTTGRAALALLDGGARYDVALLDLMMPDMSGMELHAELAQRFPATAERVVFVTGGAFTEAARAFLARSPRPFLEKPFEPAEIRTAVAAVARGGTPAWNGRSAAPSQGSDARASIPR